MKMEGISFIHQIKMFRNYILFESLKDKGINIDFSKVGAFVTFIDKPVETGKLELQLSDLKAVAFYIDAENTRDMLFKAFVLSNGQYIFQDSLEGRTTKITSNDIHDVARVLFDKPVTKISFYDFNNVPKNGDHNEIFSKKIKSQIPNNSFNIKSGGLCKSPCSSGSGNCWYETDEVGENYYVCRDLTPYEICPEDEAEETITDQGAEEDPDLSFIQKYNFPQIKEDLYFFRDNYLNVHNGGANVINLYYGFSGKIDFTMFSWDLSVETFDLISEVVIPMTKELKADPYSQTKILINTQESLRLNTYLDKVKLTMKDQASKDNIDAIKVKLNDYTNKPHKYITDNL